MSESLPNKPLFVFASWVEQKPLYGTEPQSLGLGIVNDYALSLFAENDGADAILNMTPRLGSQVWGRVLAFSDEQWKILASKKHGSYSPQPVIVSMEDGNQFHAVTYIAPAQAANGKQPTPEYSEKILKAFQNEGLPSAYIEETRALLKAKKTMHEETINWITAKVVEAIRVGEEFPENAAYELGGMPFVDALRRHIQPDDKAHILRFIQDEKWWHRYLATNIARSPVLDEEIVSAVRARWQQETHFHTKLAMIYLLMHSGVDETELAAIIAQLEQHKDELIPCIHQFYEGHPGGTWTALCGRLSDAKFAGANSIYLLSLALLAASSNPTQELPGSVEKLTHSQSQTERNLAVRLTKAVTGTAA